MECTYLFVLYASYAGQATSAPQSLRSLSLPPKVWRVAVDEKERGVPAMTVDSRMMPGAAEVMPEVSPVPLL